MPPGRHRIQIAEGLVLDPCAKQIYFKKDPKVYPLRIESGSSWQPVFGPSIVRGAEILLCAQNVKREATYTNSIRGFAFHPKKNQRSTNKERDQAQQKQTLPLWIDCIRSECLKDNTATPAQKFSKRGLHEIKDQTNSICRGERSSASRPSQGRNGTCKFNALKAGHTMPIDEWRAFAKEQFQWQ